MQGKEKLAQLLKSNLPSERDAAIYEVKRSLLGESEKVFLLKTLMEDESSLVRQSLAETLAEFEGGLSADILKKLLKDADPTVRLMALKSFSVSHSKPTIKFAVRAISLERTRSSLYRMSDTFVFLRILLTYYTKF